jgi:predicted tellurium resistance membrane protein TerC
VAGVDLLLNPEVWVAFITLLALEIVLGIDNIVFISILVDELPEHRQPLARRLGLGMALLMRILLLLSLSWVIGLTAPLFTVLGQEISGRDVILIGGGLFLLGKSTYEIHENLEGEEGHSSARVKATFASVLIQIILLDIVFSLDSVITAVGMVDQTAVCGGGERPAQHPSSYISATRGQTPPPTTRSHEPQTLMVEWTGAMRTSENGA